MYQKIILVGNVGQDPELRETPSGAKVCNLSVAVNAKWKSRDGQDQERTTWFNVACWNKLGETVSRWLQKGSQILVEGEIREARAYQKTNGDLGASIDVQAFDVRFIKNIRQAGQTSDAYTPEVSDDASPTYDTVPVVADDDIPF
jgi:single-strand DNA-binding protein